MRDGYAEVPVTSRAAQAELERQLARRAAALEESSPRSANLTAESAGCEKISEPEGPLDQPAPTDS
jgi:hypothetical protein